MTFIRERPMGSVRQNGVWHDGEIYWPCWLRPDGKAGGMVWTTGTPARRVLTFEQGEPVFCNLYGLRIVPRRVGDKDYLLPITGDPVYFHGAALAKIGSIK